jgi:hypothetical protein
MVAIRTLAFMAARRTFSFSLRAACPPQRSAPSTSFTAPFYQNAKRRPRLHVSGVDRFG